MSSPILATREELIAIRDAAQAGDDDAIDTVAQAIDARLGADASLEVARQVLAVGADSLLAELGG